MLQMTFVIPDRTPEDALRDVVAGTETLPEYTIGWAGPNVLLLTRRYLPDWALMAGILLAFSLIGLALLWVRYTDTLTVSVSQTPRGTSMSYSGLASRKMIHRLDALRTGLETGLPRASSVAWHPDPLARFEYRYFDGIVWTEYVSRAGVLSSDPPIARSQDV
jgi:hypothetical protein